MNFSELKKLIQRLGGVLVMDGDRPDFVMLSYNNYQELEKQGEADIPVRHDSSPHSVSDWDESPEGSHSLSVGINVADEEKIKQLNEEVAILRQEIKQREMEEMLPTDSQVED